MIVSVEKHNVADFAIVSREANDKEFLIDDDDKMILAADLLFGSKNQQPQIAEIIFSANVGRDLKITRETAKALDLLALSPEEELIDKIRAILKSDQYGVSVGDELRIADIEKLIEEYDKAKSNGS